MHVRMNAGLTDSQTSYVGHYQNYWLRSPHGFYHNYSDSSRIIRVYLFSFARKSTGRAMAQEASAFAFLGRAGPSLPGSEGRAVMPGPEDPWTQVVLNREQRLVVLRSWKNLDPEGKDPKLLFSLAQKLDEEI